MSQPGWPSAVSSSSTAGVVGDPGDAVVGATPLLSGSVGGVSIPKKDAVAVGRLGVEG